jgi:hypothetical protein
MRGVFWVTRARFACMVVFLLSLGSAESSGQERAAAPPGEALKAAEVEGRIDWQIVERATGKLLDQGRTELRAGDIHVEEGNGRDGEGFFRKEIRLNADFSIGLADFPKATWAELGGFGLVGGYSKADTFSWDWFEVDSPTHATKLQEGGELALSGVEVDAKWQIGRIEFLTDTVIRIQLFDGKPDREPDWLIKIGRGSYVNWPPGRRAPRAAAAPALPSRVEELSLAEIVGARSAAAKYSESDPDDLTLEGRRLTSEEAALLEKFLLLDPENIAVRTVLLGYYFGKTFDSGEMAEAQARHVLWLIANRPTAPALGGPEGDIHEHFNEKRYVEARSLWLKQLERHPKDTAVIANAAAFFTLADKDLSLKLLKQGAALEPTNDEWHESLGHLHSLRDEHALSLVEYEIAQRLDRSAQGRYARLPYLAEAAVEAGDSEKARAYARELLERSSSMRDTYPPYGDAHHTAHVVLGRVALWAKDVAGASKHLVIAGKAAAAEEHSFSQPALEFAAELLEAGAGEAVAEYLTHAKVFEPNDAKKFEGWIDQIRRGEKPKLSRFPR